MRTLIIIWLTLFSLKLFGESSVKPTLIVAVKGHYGIQNTIVSKENKEWICRTEITPFHVNSKQPFSSTKLKNIKKYSKNKPDKSMTCRDRVTITEFSNGEEKNYYGCANESRLADFLKDLDKNCGRN